MQLFKQAQSSCFSKGSSSSQGAPGRPAGHVVCTQDTSQQGSTNAIQTGPSSGGSSSGDGSSWTTFGMQSSSFKLRAALKGFLRRRHKHSTSPPSGQGAQCCQLYSTARAGQDAAAPADVALPSCPDSNKQSSSSSSSTTLASTTSSNSSKHVSCTSGSQQSSATAAEDGFSDGAASSDIIMKPMQQHQQSLGKQQHRLRSTAARVCAAWKVDRHSSRSSCGGTDQAARG